jgi:hypothetical protein
MRASGILGGWLLVLSGSAMAFGDKVQWMKPDQALGAARQSGKLVAGYFVVDQKGGGC